MNKTANCKVINTMTENDYEVLKRLIKLENDTITIGTELNPSIRTFNKFLKMNGFENKIKMVRK